MSRECNPAAEQICDSFNEKVRMTIISSVRQNDVLRPTLDRLAEVDTFTRIKGASIGPDAPGHTVGYSQFTQPTAGAHSAITGVTVVR